MEMILLRQLTTKNQQTPRVGDQNEEMSSEDPRQEKMKKKYSKWNSKMLC